MAHNHVEANQNHPMDKDAAKVAVDKGKKAKEKVIKGAENLNPAANRLQKELKSGLT